MTRICILGASLGTGNMGVSALACGSVTAALETVPEATVSFLDYGKTPARQSIQLNGDRAAVNLVNLRFTWKLWLRNNIVRLLMVAAVSRVLPDRWGRKWRERYGCIRAILDSQVVGSLAGGDSFSDIYGLSRLLYVALPQILVLQLGQPLILLPQTIGPFNGRIARHIARYIVGRAEVVYGRDRQSLEETKELMGPYPWKPRLAYDMAFVMAPAPPSASLDALIPKRDERETLVGINVSGLLAVGGYSRTNMFELNSDYLKLVEAVVIHFVETEGAKVVLIPHVFGDSEESDVKACQSVFDKLSRRLNGGLHLIRGDLDQHEIKYVIGQCDFFIGSRMHACIAALSQTVPAVSLAYSRKFLGVMDSLGLSELVLDLRIQTEERVLIRVRECFKDRAKLRRELALEMPTVRKRVFDVFGNHQHAPEKRPR